ncbi:YbhB/YbcL family Raf kinase inhibitor-like protein [Shewanella sp. 125m-7]
MRAIHVLSENSVGMTLTSEDIFEGQPMGDVFTFGENKNNLSPQLSWQGAPASTKSYAITVFDPDAPTGSGWWHWQVVNIPASTTSIARGASGQIAGARELANDYGSLGYGGANPPVGHGMHRYHFTLWALPVETLELPEAASAAMVGFMLNATATASATLTSVYVQE